MSAIRKVLGWFSIVLVLTFVWEGLCFPVLAQETPPAPPPAADAPASGFSEVCKMAETDAKQHHGSTGYAIGGFFCGIIGFVIAIASNPQVPADRLANVPPDQVEIYTKCYEDKAKKKNVGSACGGWALGAAVGVLIITLQDANEVSS